jgi:hypothetical protein
VPPCRASFASHTIFAFLAFAAAPRAPEIPGRHAGLILLAMAGARSLPWHSTG